MSEFGFNNITTRTPRWDENIPWFNFPERQWTRVRFIGSPVVTKIHWVKTKNNKQMPIFCRNWDVHTHSYTEGCCPIEEDFDMSSNVNEELKRMRATTQIFTHAIIRDLQKQGDPNPWRPVRMNMTMVIQLQNFSQQNDGHDVSSPQNGMDVIVFADPSNSDPAKRMQISIAPNGTVPLSAQEMTYLGRLFDIRSMIKMPDPAETRRMLSSNGVYAKFQVAGAAAGIQAPQAGIAAAPDYKMSAPQPTTFAPDQFAPTMAQMPSQAPLQQAAQAPFNPMGGMPQAPQQQPFMQQPQTQAAPQNPAANPFSQNPSKAVNMLDAIGDVPGNELYKQPLPQQSQQYQPPAPSPAPAGFSNLPIQAMAQEMPPSPREFKPAAAPMEAPAVFNAPPAAANFAQQQAAPQAVAAPIAASSMDGGSFTLAGKPVTRDVFQQAILDLIQSQSLGSQVINDEAYSNLTIPACLGQYRGAMHCMRCPIRQKCLQASGLT